jgi:hypothetical protein
VAWSGRKALANRFNSMFVFHRSVERRNERANNKTSGCVENRIDEEK